MKRYLVIAAAMTCLATPSQAGLNEGIAAAAAGNYAQAAAEYEPLANAGDPAAQYYLAKLYLEGHGPTNDVPRGVDLMTKAATGNYPEAQAQLGLMYAMGLGVKVDNAMAYDWLSKAITALPDGTRRTVAVANRDAVVQRMGKEQGLTAAAPQQAATTAEPAVPAESQTAETQTAETQTVETQTAETQTAATPEPAPAAKPAAAPEPTPDADEAASSSTVETAPAPKPVPAAVIESTPKTDPAKTQEAAAAAPTPEPAAETPAAETPAAEAPAAKPAAETPLVDSEPEQSASKEVPASEPAKTQTASAEPASKPGATEDQVKAGVRIQIMSAPNEDAVWGEWKQISKKHAAELGDLTPVVETADLGTKGIFYRLQAGPFETLDAAKERCGKLKDAGLDCLVVGKE
jgi:hypothetical protein